MRRKEFFLCVACCFCLACYLLVTFQANWINSTSKGIVAVDYNKQCVRKEKKRIVYLFARIYTMTVGKSCATFVYRADGMGKFYFCSRQFQAFKGTHYLILFAEIKLCIIRKVFGFFFSGARLALTTSIYSFQSVLQIKKIHRR